MQNYFMVAESWKQSDPSVGTVSPDERTVTSHPTMERNII